MARYTLKNEQWERLKPLLPPEKPQTGRPNHDHRRIVEGILWILRTGAPWRDLPPRFGPWQTVASRFYRWTRQGIWQQVLTHTLTGERLDVGAARCNDGLGR
jgi:transposase